MGAVTNVFTVAGDPPEYPPRGVFWGVAGYSEYVGHSSHLWGFEWENEWDIGVYGV